MSGLLRVAINGVCLLFVVVLLTTPIPSWAQAPASGFAETGPVLPSEREATWHSRDVAAHEFRDAFCAEWTDGCEACRRPHINDPIACAPDPQAAKEGSCQSKPITCQAMLPSAHRVCLSYSDGCNDGDFYGADSAVLCFANGHSRQRRPNDYECTQPRSTHYASEPEGDLTLTKEWTGTWRLQAPNGRVCRISFGSTYPLTGDADCLALPQVAHFRQAAVERGRFNFYAVGDVPKLSFKPDTLDHLVDAIHGWRLDRLDPAPFFAGHFEGVWNLAVAGQNEFCQIMLTGRDLSAPNGLRIFAPDEIAQTSACRKITPDWRRWRTQDGGLEFLDGKGGAASLRLSRDTNCYVGALAGGKPRTFALAFMSRPGVDTGGDHRCGADLEKAK